MRIGAFQVHEPAPALREPHVVSVLHPWIDAGGAGTITLNRLEQAFGARELARLERPGSFFDFTRYRPMTRTVEGERVLTVPNTILTYAQKEGYPDLIFCRMLEPHAYAEEYIDSVAQLMRHFKVRRYCRISAMWNAVPHTRPLPLTGIVEGEPLARLAPLVTVRRRSNYEGPTTIMGLLNQELERDSVESINLMVHLPQYLQLEEDYSGAARLLEAVGTLYGMSLDFPEIDMGKQQYRDVDEEVQGNSVTKDLVRRLEDRYDSQSAEELTTGGPVSEEDEEEQQETPPLAPDIQRFLRDLGQRLDDR